MNYSKYQLGVFDFATNGRGNGAIEAVAGSGKTTTGIEMVQRFGPMEQGLFSSFTNTIVNELDMRIKTLKLNNIRSKTYNSFGAGLIFKYMKPTPKLLTEYQDQKTDVCLKYNVIGQDNFDVDRQARELYYKCKTSIIKMVGLFKSLALLSVEEADAQFDDIIEYYDVDIPNHKEFRQTCLDTYHWSLQRKDIIDFNDQKLFPLLFNWQIPQVDFLVIDEYQDTCPLESQLMLRACKGGRIIVFGDRNQAIYSFKGTRPNSMQDFIDNYNATSLPLSICYRCSVAAVNEAKTIVPHIEAADGAVQGSVNTIVKNDFKKNCTDQDIVLARVTDDLVRSVLSFLAEGRGAYVEGREYGTQLKYFIETYTKGDDQTDIMRFVDIMLGDYNEKYPELIKHNKENQALVLETKVESIKALSLGCQTVFDLKRRIDTIFTNKGNGIRHMTIHKSKGLESKNDVYILRPDKLPHPRVKKPHLIEEERRLKYVAITRTKRNLNYVSKDKNEK